MKAKLNIPKTMDASDSYASLAAQRRGWETVDGFTEYPIPSAPGHVSLPNVITLQEASLLLPPPPAGGRTPLQSVFHSATADSRAVLADMEGTFAVTEKARAKLVAELQSAGKPVVHEISIAPTE